MSNEAHGIRASRYYATYRGVEYLANKAGVNILLLTNTEPLPAGFEASDWDWIRGEALVPLSELDRLVKVRTTCTWHGHAFEIGLIIGDIANVSYIGKDFDTVWKLPGMNRWEPYEIVGEVPVSELAGIEEQVEEIDLSNLIKRALRDEADRRVWQHEE